MLEARRDSSQRYSKCGDEVTSPIAEQRWSPRFVFAVHEFAGGPKPKCRDVAIWPRSGANADIPPTSLKYGVCRQRHSAKGAAGSLDHAA